MSPQGVTMRAVAAGMTVAVLLPGVATVLAAPPQGGTATQARQPGVSRVPRSVQALRDQARIDGQVVTRDVPPRPVARAAVRARDEVGRVADVTTTNEGGQFSFVVGRPGTYFVELLDQFGRVQAVEPVGNAAFSADRIAAVVLRLPGRSASPLWASTARTILGAAAAAGIGAFAASGQPASPER